MAGLQAPELSSEQVEEITQVGRSKPQRFFKGVLVQPEDKPAEKEPAASKSKGLPLSSTLLLVALFLLLLPLAMASPSILMARDGLGYANPADNGGRILTVSFEPPLLGIMSILIRLLRLDRSLKTPGPRDSANP